MKSYLQSYFVLFIIYCFRFELFVSFNSFIHCICLRFVFFCNLDLILLLQKAGLLNHSYSIDIITEKKMFVCSFYLFIFLLVSHRINPLAENISCIFDKWNCSLSRQSIIYDYTYSITMRTHKMDIIHCKNHITIRSLHIKHASTQ